MQATTAEKILNAAEALFAEHGIGAVSLRKIICKAKVNIASVHYHFGSKDELIKEVFRRRLKEVNKERLRILEELRLKHAQKIPLDKILRAMIVPALNLGSKESDGRNFFKLISRAHVETSPVVQSVLYDELHAVIEIFLKEIKKVTEHLSDKERAIRLAFVAGSMFKAALLPMEPLLIDKFLGGEMNLKEVTDMLVNFCVGGLNAPSIS